MSQTTNAQPDHPSNRSARRDAVRLKVFCRRLSKFTDEALQNTTYPVIRNYKLLCFGYIRHHEANDANKHLDIPLEIKVLIAKYYESDKVKIDSTKLLYQSGRILDFWETSEMDISYWSSGQKREWIDGIILVVDLSSYAEFIVDENGEKRNKMEYVHSVWKSVAKFRHWHQKRRAPKMLCLVNRKEFEQKLKMKSLNVCPLFPVFEVVKECEMCIRAIRENFRISVEQWYDIPGIKRVVAINDRDDVAREFKAFEQFFDTL